MPFWKVLFIAIFGLLCMGLALSTVVVPFSLYEGTDRWVWFGGLLFGTIFMSTLFTLFLRREDRKFR